MPSAITLSLLASPTRHLFFTGKGGVGKTTLACATALALADRGRSVLLISTDPASNLDEMFATTLSNEPRPVPGVPRLSAMNIDPEAAAESYRLRVLAQLGAEVTDAERESVRERLSGACTTEIAAFDEFVGLLATRVDAFDHVVFDTAPTGHTLRLLSLPRAWTGFLKGNDRGASCLGPHSGLKMQEERFKAALATLGDPKSTTIVLVSRPDRGAMREAARTSAELRALGLTNQHLAINGVFAATDRGDAVARSIEALGEQVLAALPEALRSLPQDRVPLRSFDMVGLDALRQVLAGEPQLRIEAVADAEPAAAAAIPALGRLVDELAAAGRGLIMVMGKGGVGKTTIAAALAVGLVKRGHSVHLSTTDPAAHLASTIEATMEGLRVDRIDPREETQRYVARVMASRAADLDTAGLALLREDLASPCTEEVAVFHAFSRIVMEARSAFVVLDTAPTGHTLLLMDAAGAYHREMIRSVGAGGSPAAGRIVTPLMRLQDPDYSRIVLVSLPETTPVSEAAALQEDLRRANIEPYAWVINRSLVGSGTRDPLLVRRLRGERAQIDRVRQGLARRLYMLPWQAAPPEGPTALAGLVV
ncbi:arsenical pump-driving ATPase [Reyranella sp. MMS21-HV4-11]|uniref:Arsenical pump-driving ATPase n=1 Tax=Reyranella humidisoli TaxID=2849149 RepID=A0ABS6IJ87_9HYPH|nr:arsenical pump-driving ATPase [Reyranella sp. MMS21-HV4-11]MBU8874661.1 arsenical pump-driving ATPase [Reyranella sp. MMS21-HV4-11]